MPSGKVHHGLWKTYRIPAMALSISLIFPIFILSNGSMEKALIVSSASVAGYFIGDIIGPDLDQIGIDRSEALAIKSVIFLPLIAWSTLYARIMQVLGGHRGFYSHFPFISTFIRLCWFSFPFAVLFHFMDWGSFDVFPYFIGLWIGMGMSDTIHAVADFSSSLARKFARKRRRARQTGD